MALLFAEGFDVYDSQADAVNGGVTKVEGASHTHSKTAGRYGGGCVGGVGTYPGWGAACAKGPGDRFWVSFAYWHNGSGSNFGDGDYWIYPRNGSNNQHFQLHHKADGTITIRGASATVLFTSSSGVLAANTWNWVEIEVYLGTNDTNGSLTLKVNNTTIATLTSIDTSLSGTSMVNVGFYGSSGSWYVDDIILNDNTGSDMSTAPGDSRIDTLRPDDDGTVQDWTGTFADIDDTLGSSDSDTTFITSDTPGDEARFTLSDLPSASTIEVLAVQVRTRSRNTDAGVRTMRALINQGGSEAVGSTLTPPTTYTWTRSFFVVDPDSGVQFTESDISNLQAGVEVVS